MRGLFFYIKRDEVDWVFENEDIGSRSTSFKGMAQPGTCIFVASESPVGLAIVGEIPVWKVYEELDNPKGWKFRVAAQKGTSVRYSAPVALEAIKEQLSFTRGSTNISRKIRYPRWLTPQDMDLLSRLGRRPH